MAKELPNLPLHAPLDELFSTQAQRDEEKQEHIVLLDTNEIERFKNHPFQIRDDAEMEELANSIKENGILEPCLVRPIEGGKFEMISGHRRRFAAMKAGITQIPCLVRQLSDEQATIIMVDSNRHRPYLLPSEKAFAYKMRLDAMKRQAGRPSKENGATVLPHLQGKKSREILAAESGESHEQIRKHIRLTELLPEILKMVDNSVEKPDDPEQLRMAMRPAVELSYLTPEHQKVVLNFMRDTMTTPSHAQTIQLRQLQDADTFSTQRVFALLGEEKPNQKERVSLSVDKFNRYFPPHTSAKEIERGIFKALDFYMEAKSKSRAFNQKEHTPQKGEPT